MLERISELTGALHSTLSAPNVKSSNTKYLFTTEDAQNVEAVLKLLKPFKDTTLTVSCETDPVLPILYPTFLKLMQLLEIDENDNECIEKMKTAAKNNLEKRYSNIPDVLLFSCFVHPTTKNLKFIENEKKKRFIRKSKNN